MSPQPQSILVVRLSAIGDTCHTLAVVRNLQDNWPDARLSWIIGKTEASLMADIPDVEFIIFEKSKGIGAIADVRQQLGRRRFDVTLCMHASARVNLLYPFIRSPLKLGYDKARARDFQWLFTNRRIGATHGKHVLDAMMSFAATIGAAATPLRWDIPLPAEDCANARRQRHADTPLVVISPCSSQRSRNFRNWSIDRFIAVVRHLEDEYRARVVLTGGSDDTEKQYASAISDACGSVVDLTGQTSLKALLALLAEADAIICPDSGPAHMATAVGTPVVGLYATSNPDRTGPYLSRHLTVNRYPDAARQFLGKSIDELAWGQRVRSPEAMDLIKVDEVCAKIDEVLRK